ncbi:hypothetical protein Tco_1124063 [Tanacetum coccineum]|uniref:Kinetochore protein SPC25 n=1 Tax=Tanacetum coccineum TaxID=301880 RepID=A0ABQ5J7X1_9ASTR
MTNKKVAELDVEFIKYKAEAKASMDALEKKIDDGIEKLEASIKAMKEESDAKLDAKFKELRHQFPLLPMPSNKNSLEWFVRKVQDRIVLSTLRKSLVKAASKSRLSIEYEDTDEMIVVHLVDGVDAFIKVHQWWPIANSGLKLSSLKGSSQSSKEEMVNSLDVQVCQNLSTFIDGIEDIFKQRMRIEIQSTSSINN